MTSAMSGHPNTRNVGRYPSPAFDDAQANNPAHAPATLPTARTRAKPLFSQAMISLLLICMSAGSLTVHMPAHAQDKTTSNNRPFAIPPGPLSLALSRFGAESGITLIGTSQLLQDKLSPGLQGNYNIENGFAALLAGTGLQAFQRPDGSYGLRSTNSAVSTLETVTVQGEHATQTEGSGSYTSNLMPGVATPLNLNWQDTPQTVSVMTHQRIEDQGLENIREVMQNTPGITVTDLGSERYGITSRGYGISSYQVDGLNTDVDITTNNNPQSLADMVIYDRVEVLRGASGLMSGVGDPGGAINLVRKRPGKDFQASVAGRTGSWDTYRAEVDLSSPLNQSGSVRGRLIGAHQRSHSFIDYLKTQKSIVYGIFEADLSEKTLLTLGASQQWHKRKGNFGIYGVPLFWSNGQQTDFDRSFSVASRDASADNTITDTFLTLQQGLGQDWQLKLGANYMRAHRDSHLAYAHGDNSFPNATTGQWPLEAYRVDNLQVQKAVNLTLEGSFKLLGRTHDLAMGLSYNMADTDYDYYPDTSGLDGQLVDILNWDHRGAPAPSGDKLSDINWYTQQRAAFIASRFALGDNTSLILGTRIFDHTSIYSVDNPTFSYFANETTRERGIVTPYAGITHALTDTHTLYASYAKIYKPQFYADRYGNMLDPREGGVYEIGLKSIWLDGALNTSIALYQTRQDNLAEADSGHYVPGTNYQAAYYAIKGAKTSGIDLEANGEVLPGWKVAASYTYSQTKDASGQTIKTTLPKQQIKLWTTYQLPGDWRKLTIGGGVNWQSAIHFTAKPWWAGQTLNARQSAYAVVNLMARYDFSKQLNATLNVGNVLDKKYLSALDNTFYSGYYGAPRNVMLDIRYQFQ